MSLEFPAQKADIIVAKRGFIIDPAGEGLGVAKRPLSIFDKMFLEPALERPQTMNEDLRRRLNE